MLGQASPQTQPRCKTKQLNTKSHQKLQVKSTLRIQERPLIFTLAQDGLIHRRRFGLDWIV